MKEALSSVTRAAAFCRCHATSLVRWEHDERCPFAEALDHFTEHEAAGRAAGIEAAAREVQCPDDCPHYLYEDIDDVMETKQSAHCRLGVGCLDDLAERIRKLAEEAPT